MIEMKTFRPFKHGIVGPFTRADLEIYGINTFRPSFTAHVFFNDQNIELPTIPMDRETYAGRFSVFGHPRCLGDEGHCHISNEQRRFDTRPSSPLTPAFRRIVVTEALRRASSADTSVQVTIIAIADAQPEDFDGDYLLNCSGLQIAIFG